MASGHIKSYASGIFPSIWQKVIFFYITYLFLHCFSSLFFFGWVDGMCPVTRVGRRLECIEFFQTCACISGLDCSGGSARIGKRPLNTEISPLQPFHDSREPLLLHPLGSSNNCCNKK